ncbi:hypothetical protein [Citromicrobium bathyomarinum]|uniref:hypothetical protein n=1 Tax=Citromicrobium bathyomarinum TaxID=72174 RepID=UPI00315AA8C9
MTRYALVLPAVALLLSACGDEKAPDADATEEAGPQGQVYGGTISDAMLPVGEVKSQSPQRGNDGPDADADKEDEDDAE